MSKKIGFLFLLIFIFALISCGKTKEESNETSKIPDYTSEVTDEESTKIEIETTEEVNKPTLEESEAPVIPDDDLIKDLEAKRPGAEVKLSGIITYLDNEGYIINDQTGDIFIESTTKNDFQINDLVGVSGTLSFYGKDRVVETSSLKIKKDNLNLDYVLYDFNKLSHYVEINNRLTPAMFNGILKVVNNKYQVQVGDKEIIKINIQDTKLNLNDFNNKPVLIKGYLFGSNKVNNDYELNFLLTSCDAGIVEASYYVILNNQEYLLNKEENKLSVVLKDVKENCSLSFKAYHDEVEVVIKNAPSNNLNYDFKTIFKGSNVKLTLEEVNGKYEAFLEGMPDSFVLIKDAINKNKGDEVLVRGVVSAVNTRGYTLYDNENGIYVYEGSLSENIKIGKEVLVEGTVDYYNTKEILPTKTIVLGDKDFHVSLNNLGSVGFSDLISRQDDKLNYYKVQGTLSVEKHYNYNNYHLHVLGSDAPITFKFLSDEFSELALMDNFLIEINFYSLGVASDGSGKLYLNGLLADYKLASDTLVLKTTSNNSTDNIILHKEGQEFIYYGPFNKNTILHFKAFDENVKFVVKNSVSNNLMNNFSVKTNVSYAKLVVKDLSNNQYEVFLTMENVPYQTTLIKDVFADPKYQDGVMIKGVIVRILNSYNVLIEDESGRCRLITENETFMNNKYALGDVIVVEGKIDPNEHKPFLRHAKILEKGKRETVITTYHNMDGMGLEALYEINILDLPDVSFEGKITFNSEGNYEITLQGFNGYLFINNLSSKMERDFKLLNTSTFNFKGNICNKSYYEANNINILELILDSYELVEKGPFAHDYELYVNGNKMELKPDGTYHLVVSHQVGDEFIFTDNLGSSLNINKRDYLFTSSGNKIVMKEEAYFLDMDIMISENGSLNIYEDLSSDGHKYEMAENFVSIEDTLSKAKVGDYILIMAKCVAYYKDFAILDDFNFDTIFVRNKKDVYIDTRETDVFIGKLILEDVLMLELLETQDYFYMGEGSEVQYWEFDYQDYDNYYQEYVNNKACSIKPASIEVTYFTKELFVGDYHFNVLRDVYGHDNLDSDTIYHVQGYLGKCYVKDGIKTIDFIYDSYRKDSYYEVVYFETNNWASNDGALLYMYLNEYHNVNGYDCLDIRRCYLVEDGLNYDKYAFFMPIDAYHFTLKLYRYPKTVTPGYDHEGVWNESDEWDFDTFLHSYNKRMFLN